MYLSDVQPAFEIPPQELLRESRLPQEACTCRIASQCSMMVCVSMRCRKGICIDDHKIISIFCNLQDDKSDGR